MITILITGVGGPLGQALIKAARQSTIPCRVVGTDRNSLSTGLDWVDSPHLLANASDAESYLAGVRQLCSAEAVSLILPGSDAELSLLSANAEALRAATGAIVVASPPAVLRISMDKWETSRFLEGAGVHFPRTSALDNEATVNGLVAEFGFPLIAKPCLGSGSRGLHKVRSWEDIGYLRTLGTAMVLQEYLQPDTQEYTVAVYTQRDGRQAGSIAMKRELVAGNTYRAWVDQNPVVLAEAEAIVRALRPSGPCNVQLRLTPRGPVAFEINARFSGTTAMRAHFGFNEVEMAVRDLALYEPVPAPTIRPGIALRFWDEVYRDAEVPPETVQKPSAGAMRVLTTAQAEEWNAVLRRTAQHDFYFLPSYHALAEQRGEGEARLFVYERDGYLVALPLMLRSLADLPELGAAAGSCHDASSVYGYAGPLTSHEEVPEPVRRGFQAALAESLRELQVVCAFSRLNPLVPQHALLDGLGECRTAGQTVSIDLTLSPEAQRARFRSAARTRINRLVREGVTCAIDREKRHLREFVSIYHETMRRVGAHNAYFFDEEYFVGLVRSLGSALELFIVTMPDGELGAGGLFTLCDGVVQYHLGGTRDAALKLSPMPLVFETVRLWANEQRARVLHLGGGVGAKADSLFHFKSGFSDRRHDFATWRWIVAPEVYRALGEERQRWNAEHHLDTATSEFFPAYRQPARPRLETCAPGVVVHQQQPSAIAVHG
ncbi:MAG: putative carbamoyl-phosphate synthase large subunit [Chthoniobacter sp.]|nr:putative carbamoyl-phosphate synthase large subunit [Chthoniobacter sp.]